MYGYGNVDSITDCYTSIGLGLIGKIKGLGGLNLIDRD